MKIILFFLLVWALTTPITSFSQNLSAQEVLQKSIQYHDPGNKWEKGSFLLPLYESRPNGGYRLTDVLLDNGQQVFQLQQIRGKDRLSRYLSPDSCGVSWNYQSNISAENQKRLRLHCNGGNTFFKDYYAYLYGLPMKLQDPGTQIDPTVKTKDFFSQELLEIKVTYDPSVGNDIWYFYFDPNTYAMRGYRFYHDESKNDGEYILIEEEVTINGVIFPKKRAWYTHKEGKYLGNDDLMEYAATKY